jgi:eukaryotic-like serine/threonine-protein kinase
VSDTNLTPSTTSASDLPLDHGPATWDALAGRIDALIQRWEAAESPPVLAEFVPQTPASLRRLVLVELVKVDLDYRYQRKQPKRIEDYVAEFPELSGPHGVPSDLIFEEYQVRRRAGEQVRSKEYFDRFPNRTNELAQLLGLNAPTEVTLGHKGHPEAAVQTGQRLDDFDLQTLLGEGAFAKVFLAWQRSMQRRVALKVSSDRGDEPQTLAQLDHPHIVRVYDQRQIPDRNLRLLYMPYLPGGTLHDVLKLVRCTPAEARTGQLLLDAVDASLAKRNEPAPLDSANRQRLAAMNWPEAVCHLGARLAEALDYAHRQGVLHRDIKPANVLLGADAAPRLADFNVGSCSKLEGASPAAFFGGSVPYMSPEQNEAFNPAHPREVSSLDGRSDIYSLAVTLWELLTGRRPFPDEKVTGDWGNTLADLNARRRAGVTPETLATLPSNLPSGMRDVLLQCLNADPDQRFATAGEMARELDLCLKPRTRELLYPPPGWRQWVRRYPLLAFVATGLLPNALASLFSIEYNKSAIIEKFSTAENFAAAEKMFRFLQLVVNATFFPVGVILFVMLIWPVVAGLRRVRRGPLPAMELARLRRRCLFIGPGCVLIGVFAWVVAGIVFPVTMHLTVQKMDADFHFHFLVSQTLCGLIAASYPLFGMHFLALRTMYPAFLGSASLTADDVAQLNRLDSWLGRFLWLAASIPMLAMLILALMESKYYAALAVLSALGMAGFGVAYLLAANIREDKEALLELARK